MNLPVDSIGTFVALGGTFHTHLDEKERAYRWPDLWIVPDTAVIPDGDPIRIPDSVEDIKPGSELTAVIGETIQDADETEAWEAIKGFTVSNDVTASGDWPGWSDPDHGMITGVGYKLLPTFSPILTEYVPKRDLVEYEDLEVAVHVDDELAVEGTTALLAFSIPELVSFASKIVPLEENDVVALGDPGRPSKFLDDAESVTCRVAEVGTLTNPVERT
ncbi:fumarylacetoacetate hydrolase family protein [Halosimplex sp. TS25]|uniref:fumarylacetoacetate hydrolase family protein n=1 Tax=Halosimplex rarum TaxID=3396619 RepID=UPI0039EB778A